MKKNQSIRTVYIFVLIGATLFLYPFGSEELNIVQLALVGGLIYLIDAYKKENKVGAILLLIVTIIRIVCSFNRTLYYVMAVLSWPAYFAGYILLYIQSKFPDYSINQAEQFGIYPVQAKNSTVENIETTAIESENIENISPIVNEDNQIIIEEEPLRIDAYRVLKTKIIRDSKTSFQNTESK